MRRLFTRLLALVLVCVMGLSSWTAPAIAGNNYRQDTLDLIETLRTAVDLPKEDPQKEALQAAARQKINDFAARYRRNGSLTKLSSFTTMRTALNSLAGHYSSYPNRPVPQKLKDRLEMEFKQVEAALKREEN
jgi:photosystem II Psb27 protein